MVVISHCETHALFNRTVSLHSTQSIKRLCKSTVGFKNARALRREKQVHVGDEELLCLGVARRFDMVYSFISLNGQWWLERKVLAGFVA